MAKFTTEERAHWLERDIPHRIRALLAKSPRLYAELGIREVEPKSMDRRQRRCEKDSICEGRFAALRWMIEFLGVRQDSHGRPARRKPDRGHDAWIEDLAPCAAFDLTTPEAVRLAVAWEGCSEHSSHATERYATKSTIEDKVREEAVDIAIEHLSKTIYKRTPDWLQRFVLVSD